MLTNPTSPKISLSRRIILGAVLLSLFAAKPLTAAINYGPNLLPNSSFEGGAEQWTASGPFSVVNNAANAHTGSYELQAAFTAKPSKKYCYQSADIWPNTNYVSTIWIKGSGTVQFGVQNSANKQNLSTLNITATSAWTQITLPWNSGSATNVWVFVYDSVSGNAKGSKAYLDDCQTYLANGYDIHFNPAAPAASGYTLMFDDEFTNPATADSNRTGATGYYWYLNQYFGLSASKTNMYSIGSGTLTISNDVAASGMTLHTTEPDPNTGKGFHGTVFSGGAGIYVESDISLENMSKITSKSWPALWSEDIKDETGLNDQMPGNPKDIETIEEDFMEYNPVWNNGNAYVSTIHDFAQVIASGKSYDVQNDNCAIPVPLGTDYTQKHTYGTLWVPASAANGWIGYRQAFFDGVPQAAVCWQGNQVGTFPPSGSYLYSLIDKDQFDIIYGGVCNKVALMQSEYIHVYAVSPSSVTVVPAGKPGTNYGTTAVSGAVGNNVQLSFAGLSGNPSGATYVWYQYGIKVATTTTPSYTITNAQAAQSGAYSVFASSSSATGSATFTVTIK